MALSAVCLFGRNCYKMWRSLAGTVLKCGVVWPELIKCGFAHYVCLVGRNCYKMRHCVFVWPALYKIYRCLFGWSELLQNVVYALRTFYLFGQNCYTMWRCLFVCLVGCSELHKTGIQYCLLVCSELI